MAKPVRKRATSSHVSVGARAPASPKTTPSATVVRNTLRRPTRSARYPQNHAPNSIPAKVAVSSIVAAGEPLGNSNAALMPGSAKPIRSTSIASAAQVSPQMASSFHWKRPRPRSSSTRSTVMGTDFSSND